MTMGLMMLDTPDDSLDPVDRDALQRAMKLAMRDPKRAEQLLAKLESEPWVAVAKFAAYCMQTNSLRLRPWESPPCFGYGAGEAMLNKLLDHGISQWE